jgi:hypothetical protein
MASIFSNWLSQEFEGSLLLVLRQSCIQKAINTFGLGQAEILSPGEVRKLWKEDCLPHYGS